MSVPPADAHASLPLFLSCRKESRLTALPARSVSLPCADMTKVTPMLVEEPAGRFTTTVAAHGRPDAFAADGTLWASVTDTVVVEESGKFEQAARVLINELAKMPECK